MILFIVMFFPWMASSQEVDIFSKLKFIEEFKVYHTQATSKEGTDWALYNEKKKSFDKKIQSLIINKDVLMTEYDAYLVEKERKTLNTLFEKYSSTVDSNEKLKNELLKWKADRGFFYEQSSLNDLFEKLDFLKEESKVVSDNSDDITGVLLFESRLEEITELVKKLK